MVWYPLSLFMKLILDLAFLTNNPHWILANVLLHYGEQPKEMTKHFAWCQVNDTVRTQNGPNTLGIKTAPIDSHAMVYRPEKGRWEGFYSKLDIDGEYCTLLLPPPSGPSKFRTTVVKRYFPKTLQVPNINSEERNSVISNPPLLNGTSAKKEN